MIMEEARQFWDTESLGQQYRQGNTLEFMICEKLDKKVSELISIIIESQN